MEISYKLSTWANIIKLYNAHSIVEVQRVYKQGIIYSGTEKTQYTMYIN